MSLQTDFKSGKPVLPRQRQKRFLISITLLVFHLLINRASATPDLAGNWSLYTVTGAGTFGYLLQVLKVDTNYYANLISIDQGYNLWADSVSFNPPNFEIVSYSLGEVFDGTVSPDGGSLSISTNPVQTFERQASVDDFLPAVYNDSHGTLPYRLFVPPDYNSTNKYPLVMFLHGSGQRGTDNQIQLTGDIGILAFLSKTNQIRHPCFLVAPQCPTSGTWNDTNRRLQLPGLLAAIQSQYNIDPDRLYVTGLSMGGIGSWDQITLNPSLYAAAVPMSGNGNTGLAPAIKTMPIWNFHAANDSVVNVSGSRSMVNAVRLAGGRVIYTEYALGGHPIWTPAYYTPSLVDWVMAQKRGMLSSTSPLTTVTSPNTNATFATGGTTITLAGTTADTNTAVTSVTWKNYRNGSAGAAVGTNNWSVNNLPLQPGVDNLISVTATGTSWMQVFGGNTTFNTAAVITQVQSPIKLAISLYGANVSLGWSGGVPPYLIQKSTNLLSGIWMDVQSTAGTNATFPINGDAALYRVGGQ